MRVPANEVFNGVTHFVGAALSLAGLVALVILADDTLTTVAVTVYGASLVALYLASAFYHILPVRPRAKRFLKRVDQTAIYLLIAGTYTPVALTLLPTAWAWGLLAVVWGLAAVGVTVRWAWPNRARLLHYVLYLVMGWAAVVAAKPLLAAVSLAGVAWLLAGGLLYTVGVAVLGARRPDPWPKVVGHHGVWHLMVMAGSVAHYVFMVAYVV